MWGYFQICEEYIFLITSSLVSLWKATRTVPWLIWRETFFVFLAFDIFDEWWELRRCIIQFQLRFKIILLIFFFSWTIVSGSVHHYHTFCLFRKFAIFTIFNIFGHNNERGDGALNRSVLTEPPWNYTTVFLFSFYRKRVNIFLKSIQTCLMVFLLTMLSVS